MSYLDTLKKYKLNESIQFDEEEEIDEMSTSAGAGAYLTPNAFGDVDDDTIEMLGYKKVKKVKRESKPTVDESEFVRMSRRYILMKFHITSIVKIL